MVQSSARIVREVHDEPHIDGSRITVRFIHQRVEEAGLDPQTVADRHTLDLADVYHALAYYYVNEDEKTIWTDTGELASVRTRTFATASPGSDPRASIPTSEKLIGRPTSQIDAFSPMRI